MRTGEFMENQEKAVDPGTDCIELFPVGRDMLVDKTRDVLRDAIVTGRIVQGQRINETIIARQLSVSRGPIREALSSLEKEGLVNRAPNRGMFVVKFTRADVDELYALRTMYELYALRHTLSTGYPLPMEALEAVVADMTGSSRNDEGATRATRADMVFHTTLIAACGLKRLIAAWGELKPQLQMLLHRRKVVGADYPDIVEPSHRDLLRALRSNDTALAESALREHIDGSYQAIIAHWDDDGIRGEGQIGGRTHG